MKKNFIKKMFFSSGVVLFMLNMPTILLADGEVEKFIDITPPTGSIQVLTDFSDGVDEVDIKITATDDISSDSEIMYALSTEPFSNAEKYTGEWEQYVPNKTINIKFNTPSAQGRVYAMFKDKDENISKVYVSINTQYKVTFNANAYNVQQMPVSQDENGFIGHFGAPFVIPNQPPKKSKSFFLGWSTNPLATEASYNPGDIIPASAFSVNTDSIDLYAIWTRDTEDLPLLASVVSVGDYVRYPVVYTNVTLSSTSKVNDGVYEGWRVIDITDDGEVKLISAGIPLGYKALSGNNYTNNINAVTTNFLTTEFTGSKGGYTKDNGFGTYASLTKAFTNAYTKTNSNGTPVVSSLTEKDIFAYTEKVAEKVGDSSLKITSIESNTNLAKGAYDNLFDIEGYYWIGYGRTASILWGFIKYNVMWFANDSCALKEDTGNENGVRPIVTLRSNVYTEGRDKEGVWEIVM